MYIWNECNLLNYINTDEQHATFGKKIQKEKERAGSTVDGRFPGDRRKFYERDPDAKMPWSLDSHSRSLCFPLSRLIKYYLVFMTLKDTKFMQTLVNWGGWGFLKLDFLSLIFFVMAPN